MSTLDSAVAYAVVAVVLFVVTAPDDPLHHDDVPMRALFAALWPLALVAGVAFGIWMAAQRLRGGAR